MGFDAINAYAQMLVPKYAEYIKETQKKLQLKEDYLKKAKENLWELTQFMDSNYERVDPISFYQDIFTTNQATTDKKTMTPNSIFLYYDTEKEKLRRRIMFSDTWEEDYIEYIEKNPMTLCSGISYFGKRNNSEHAGRMHAMIFDLDGVTIKEMRNIIARTSQEPSKYGLSCPKPTYIVLSGTGVHIYYVFDRPIDLYPNIKLQLNNMKHYFTYSLWDYKSTSSKKDVQFQSIFQGFRMVGSVNSKYGTDVIAFCTGDKVSLEYMNSYIHEENRRVDVNKPFAPTKYTKAEAMEKFPEWYQRRIVEGQKSKKKWDIAGKVNGSDPHALYHWWLNKVKQATGGHRYYFMMCTVIYGCKCDIPKSQIKKDLYALYNELKKVQHDNPLTEDDIKSALDVYAKDYYNFTINDIQKLTAIKIEKNKRNHRNQKTHLKIARSTLEIMNEEHGSALQGRPSAEETIKQWQQKHPEGTKVQCKNDTGLTYPTIRKWWNAN